MTRRGAALELAVLGLLHDAPMHGYELRKQLIALLGWGRVLSYGTLYPCLKALTKAGYIIADPPSAVTVRPGAAEPRRRNRIVYQLTAEGKERFAKAMEDSGPDGVGRRELRRSLCLLRAHRLRRRGCGSSRVGAAGWRNASTMSASRPPADASGLDSYTLELQRHGLESVEREVNWLTELIDRERSGQNAHQEHNRPVTNTERGDNRWVRPRIRWVAIVGVGNCATSLIQGVEYYKDADAEATVPGLMHVQFGDYHVRDIEFVAAFDVDAKKVGFDLADATTASENNTIKIADVPPTGVTVQRGHTLDGLGKYYRETIDESDAEPVDVVQVLKDTQADVLVSYLPVGSEEADKFYAQCAIDAKVAFVNALPVFIASDPEWAKKFEDAGVPIIGDDIKSQVGATITHRVMAKLFEDRGVMLDRTYQLNVGGNMDFKNMLERERLESKKISKTQAVTSNLTGPLAGETRNVHIGPSDYVAWLDDRKWAYVRLEGRAFGDVPLNLEYKLEVWDSPNSAGIIIDAIRAAKIAKDRGIGGALLQCVVLPDEVPAGAASRRPRAAASSRRSSAATKSAEAFTGLRTSAGWPWSA